MKNGEKLKELIDELGVTQKTFAKTVGVSESTLSGYIHTTREPDMSTLAQISKTLNVSADFLLDLQFNSDTAFSVTEQEKIILERLRTLSQQQRDLVNEMIGVLLTHAERQTKFGRRASDRPPSEFTPD